MYPLFNRFSDDPNDNRVLTVFWDKTELKVYVFLTTDTVFFENENNGFWNKASALTSGNTDSNFFANKFYTESVLPSKTETNYLDSRAYTSNTNDRISFVLQCQNPIYPYVKPIITFDTSFCDLNIDNLFITDSSVQIIATSSKTGIQYSLDNKNFQASHFFFGLQPNTQYTAYVRDSGLCIDSENFKTRELLPSYGLLYHTNYYDFRERRTDIEIYKDGYNGTVYEYRTTNTPAVIDLLGEDKIEDSVKGTAAALTFISFEDYKYLDLFVENPLKYLVKIKKQGEVIWNGYIETESYREDYRHTPYAVELMATDGLSYLKEVPFSDDNLNALRGRYSLLDILVFSFSKLTYDFNFHFGINTFETNHDTNICILEQTFVEAEAFYGDSIYTVIYKITASLGCQFNWNFDTIDATRTGFFLTEKLQNDNYTIWQYSKNGTFQRTYTANLVKEISFVEKAYDDRWVGKSAGLEILPAAKSFTNIINLYPKTAIIQGFKDSDFEIIGGQKVLDLPSEQVFNNPNDQSFYGANIYIGNLGIPQVAYPKGTTYNMPAKLRFWAGSATVYYTENKKDKGIKLVIENKINVLSTKTKFLLAYPKFTLTTGLPFPHKIKVSFDYLLETFDELDSEKEYNFNFALNVNGNTDFFSISEGKWKNEANLFQTVNTKEVNRRASYNIELSLRPLYTYTNGVPSMQESDLFFRLESLRGQADLAANEYYVETLSVFNLTVEILPFGNEPQETFLNTRQNSNKFWRSKVDYETFFTDVDRELPNAKHGYYSTLYLSDGNTTQKWNSHFAQNKPLQEINLQKFSGYYDLPKQKLNGDLFSEISFMSIIRDKMNYSKDFVISQASYDDMNQLITLTLLEFATTVCKVSFALLRENCCKKSFILLMEHCLPAPIVENPNIVFEISAEQNIASFGESNFAKSGGAGVTIYNFALNPNGGLLAFDVNVYYQSDKAEIYHNRTQKATTSMLNTLAGLTTFSSVIFSNSDYGLDVNGRDGGSWYIGGARGDVPNRLDIFQTATGQTIASPYGGSEWQRLWWSYSSADYATNPIAQLVISGTNGTAWEVTKVTPSNETLLADNQVSYTMNNVTQTYTSVLTNGGADYKTVLAGSTITCQVTKKSSKFLRWETDGGGTFSPSNTSETATITADGTFTKIIAIFEFRRA